MAGRLHQLAQRLPLAQRERRLPLSGLGKPEQAPCARFGHVLGGGFKNLVADPSALRFRVSGYPMRGYRPGGHTYLRKGHVRLRKELHVKLKLGLIVTAIAVMLASVAGFATSSAQAAKPGAGSVPVAINEAGQGVVGTFYVSRFQVVDGTLTAIGTFTGTANGVPVVGTPASAPVSAINGDSLAGAAGSGLTAQQTGSCEILDLTLGPLHLDLLGLVVDLNQVHLTITAEQGPGNLLGNLLCAVAGLLDNTGARGGGGGLQGITSLLNQIISILNGL